MGWLVSDGSRHDYRRVYGLEYPAQQSRFQGILPGRAEGINWAGRLIHPVAYQTGRGTIHYHGQIWIANPTVFRRNPSGVHAYRFQKPELLKDKEALNAVTIEAMRLAAAAKIDLKDAVTATTVSLNMYGESADQAARYVNVLAAGSKEGAADVSAQAAAIKMPV